MTDVCQFRQGRWDSKDRHAESVTIVPRDQCSFHHDVEPQMLTILSTGFCTNHFSYHYQCYLTRWPSQQVSALSWLGVLGCVLDMSNANKYVFSVSHVKWKNQNQNSGPQCPTPMSTILRRIDQDLSRLEKYSLVSGLSMNFFFVFHDTAMGRKLVHTVSHYNPHPLDWPHLQFLLKPSFTTDLLHSSLNLIRIAQISRESSCEPKLSINTSLLCRLLGSVISKQPAAVCSSSVISRHGPSLLWFGFTVFNTLSYWFSCV